MSETPESPTPENNDPILTKPGLKNPALLFLVLLVPLVLAVYMALGHKGAPEAPASVPAAKVAKIDGAAPISPGRGVANAAAGREALAAASASSCFPELLSLKPNDDVISRIKAAGKTYRILPPGAAMTMDYSADRVNLELDEQGFIHKVWCG